jgi:hypothetical protein
MSTGRSTAVLGRSTFSRKLPWLAGAIIDHIYAVAATKERATTFLAPVTAVVGEGAVGGGSHCVCKVPEVSFLCRLENCLVRCDMDMR